MKYPEDIVVWKEKIFVTDLGNNRIQIFDINGNFVTMLSSNVIHEKFERPHSIAISDNKIFVADSPVYHVQIFEASDTLGQKNVQPEETSIPDWIKNNAGWWAEDQIDDSDFVKGIEYMIQKGIIKIEKVQTTVESSDSIPPWIKNNAGWWSKGLISDNEFIKGIEYLVKSKIIKV